MAKTKIKMKKDNQSINYNNNNFFQLPKEAIFLPKKKFLYIETLFTKIFILQKNIKNTILKKRKIW